MIFVINVRYICFSAIVEG